MRRIISGLFVATLAGTLAPVMAEAATCALPTACYLAANSGTGPGIEGTSAGPFGVWGITTLAATGSNHGYGVYGEDRSSGTGALDFGVYGRSTYGTGAGGASKYKTGVSGTSVYGIGSYGASTSGTAAYFSTGGNGTPNSVGAYVANANGNALEAVASYVGIVARAPAAGFPIVATDPSGNNLFYVDGSGNVFFHGTLNTFARTSSGRPATAFAPQSTAPTVEDVGSAQLVAGAATVTLGSAFATALDPRETYHVFLTPDGDTRGLYVAAKTPAGFVVRETQGGRGSFAFDYRVVGTAFGSAGKRSAFVASGNASAQPKAMPYSRLVPSEVPPQ
jgi:hypothetical protein